MLTWRHSFNIHTIAHNSGGKNEVQLRTLSHLPLWCRVVPVSSVCHSQALRLHGALGRHAAGKAGTTARNGQVVAVVCE